MLVELVNTARRLHEDGERNERRQVKGGYSFAVDAFVRSFLGNSKRESSYSNVPIVNSGAVDANMSVS